jgi:hypothetical protein
MFRGYRDAWYTLARLRRDLKDLLLPEQSISPVEGKLCLSALIVMPVISIHTVGSSTSVAEPQNISPT